MPIAKLKREKRKDPLWGIILSVIVGSVLWFIRYLMIFQDGGHYSC